MVLFLENGLSWHWHWPIFLGAFPVLVGVVPLARAATNGSAVHELGPHADYRLALRTRPATIVIGTIMAGAIYGALMTGVAGFFV